MPRARYRGKIYQYQGDGSRAHDLPREQRPANTPVTPSPERRRRRQPNMPYINEYQLKRQWYERYYPGTMIADMPYRTPGWGKRGWSWEKMHGRLVKFRQRSRYGG